MKSIETLEERVEDLEFDYAESERARHWLSSGSHQLSKA